MKNYNQTKNYYDDFAGWYEKERHYGYHAMLDILELNILKPLSIGNRVLEVGAGTGLIMNRLSESADQIIGLDISAGMLKKAASRGLSVLQGSAVDLPFEDEKFDLTYSLKVLAHIPDIKKAVSEMARVTKKGGYIAAEFYNIHSIRYLAKRIGGPKKISDNRTEAEVYTRWDTPKQIIGYLPSNVEFESWRGVRIFTPAATAFKIPGLSSLLPRIEGLAAASPLARFGGFLIAVCRKR